MWKESNTKEFTIVRWQGGYADVTGRLPGTNLIWKARGARFYVAPDVMADGFNVIRGEAITICTREKIPVISLRRHE